MHELQKRILKLALSKNISQMKLREIGNEIRETHPQKIKHHLNQLISKGLIKYDKERGLAEKIKVGSIDNHGLVNIPIFGIANCGEASFYADEIVEGFLKISGSLLKKQKDIFALKASGNSMNRTNIDNNSIEDGDYVLIDPNEKNPKSGECILSIIDNKANIKKFIKDKDNKQIILVSESSQNYPPIYISEKDSNSYLVNGKVIQVIKKPKGV